MNIKSLILAFTLLQSATACVNASEAEKEAAKGCTLAGTSNLVEKSIVILSIRTDAKLEIEDSAYTAKQRNFYFKKRD